jgi:hypothetical protein
MIGISTPNNRLKRFEPAIAQGQILLMVDVPHSRVDDVAVLSADHYVAAALLGPSGP